MFESEFEKYLERNGIDISSFDGFYGYGYNFEDTRVGDIFFISFDWVITMYTYKPQWVKNMGLNNFIKYVYQEIDLFINDFTDKWKIISKYKRVEDLNPYHNKKYHHYPLMKIKNLRTKEIITWGNMADRKGELELISFLYFEKISGYKPKYIKDD